MSLADGLVFSVLITVGTIHRTCIRIRKIIGKG